MSYRLIINGLALQDNGIFKIIWVIPRAEIDYQTKSKRYDITINPITLMFVNLEAGVGYENSKILHVGTEIDLIMMFSWVFLPFKLKTDKDGNLNKLIEPYYRYKNNINMGGDFHEVGFRIGYAIPSLSMKK